MAKKQSAPKVTDQTKLLQAMQTLLEEQAKVYEKINSMLSDQIKLTQELGDATQSAGKKATDSNQKQTTSQKELNDAIDKTIDKSKEQDKANSIQVKSFKDLKNAIASTAKGAALLSTGMSALSNIATFSKGVFSAFGGIIESTFSVGMGFVNAFIGTIDGLFAVGAEVYNIGLDIQRAWEDVRETFGNLAKNEGAAVKGAFDNLRAGTGGLMDGGRGLRLIFGDIQSQIAAVSSFAEGMGASFTVLKDSFVDNAKQTLMMNKGLGLTAEAFKELSTNAMVTGSNVTESLDEVMVTTMAMSEQFGVSGKLIGKNFNEMAKNVTQFGDLSEKELVATATYAAKLGLEIQTLTSVMDKFDTFDSAADSAGKLAEVMGMNVDVMKMMNAESPAERIDEMRRAFQDTGKSVSDLSRHELKMLQDSMGFADAGELKRALSIPVDELGYDEMADAAEEAADKMTPEEAMKGMTDEIRKLVDQMQKMTGGPFAEFLKGIKDGIANSPEFIALFGNLGTALSKFYKIGKQVGVMFGKFFSTETGPLSGFMAALKDVLGATKELDAMLVNVKTAFDNFFKNFTIDPATAMMTLFDDIKAAFAGFFDSKSASMKILQDGVVNGLTAAFQAIGKLAPKIIKDASKYLQVAVDALKDFLAGKTSGAGSGLGGAFVDALISIKDSFVKDMLPVLGDLFWTLMKKAAPYLGIVLGLGIAAIIAKAVVVASVQMAVIDYMGPVLKTVAGWFGIPVKDADPEKGASAEVVEKLGEQVEATKSFSEKINDASSEINKVKKMDLLKAAGNLVIIGTIVMAALSAFGIAAAAFMSVAGSALIALGIDRVAAGLGGSVVLAVVAVKGYQELEKAGKKEPDWKKLGNALKMGAAGMVSLGLFGAAAWAFHELIGSYLADNAEAIAMGITTAAGVAIAAALTLAGLNYIGKIKFDAKSVGIGLAVAAIGIAALAVFAAEIWLFSGVFTTVGDMAPKLLAGLEAIGTFIGGALVLMITAALVGLAFIEPTTASLIAITMALGLAVMVAGMMALSAFTATIIPIGQEIIDSIDKLSNPATLERGLKLINMVIEAMTPILDVGMTAMKISAQMSGGIMSFFTGGSDSFVKAMDSIKGFMKELIPLLVGDDGILGKVKQAITDPTIAGMSEAQMKKAALLGDVLGGIGSIIGGIGPIIETFGKMSDGMFTTSTTAVKNMKSLAGPDGPITQILDQVAAFLPKMITSMEAAIGGIEDPKALSAGADVLTKVVGSFTSVIDLYSKIADFGMEMEEGVFNEKAAYIPPALKFLSTGEGSHYGMTETVDLSGSITNFANEMTALGTGIAGLKEVDMGPLGASLSSMMKFMGIVGDFGSWMGGGSTGGWANLLSFGLIGDRENGKFYTEGASSLMAMLKSDHSPGKVAATLAAEVTQIASALASMGVIDLEELNLQALADPILGFDGEKEFTVNPGNIAVKIKMNVTMNAGEVAQSISVAADGDSYFELTEKGKTAIEDMEDV